MSRQDLIKTGSMMAQEVLSALHLPGSVTLSRAVEAALKKRFDTGVAALMAELAQAGAEGVVFGDEDHDEFVQMLLRFHDSMQRGTAIRNLKLLGRLIIGLKAEGSFHIDEFTQLAGALEGLSLKELELLAEMYRLSLEHGDDCNALWSALRTRTGNIGVEDDELISRLNALSRTGFVVSLSGWGSLVYVPAPSLLRLAALLKWPRTPDSSPKN